MTQFYRFYNSKKAPLKELMSMGWMFSLFLFWLNAAYLHEYEICYNNESEDDRRYPKCDLSHFGVCA